MTEQIINIFIHRYMSIKKDNEEIYVQDLSDTADFNSLISDGKNKLKLLHEIMPKSKWKITIETLIKHLGRRRYQVWDVETQEHNEFDE